MLHAQILCCLIVNALFCSDLLWDVVHIASFLFTLASEYLKTVILNFYFVIRALLTKKI